MQFLINGVWRIRSSLLRGQGVAKKLLRYCWKLLLVKHEVRGVQDCHVLVRETMENFQEKEYPPDICWRFFRDSLLLSHLMIHGSHIGGNAHTWVPFHLFWSPLDRSRLGSLASSIFFKAPCHNHFGSGCFPLEGKSSWSQSNPATVVF